MTDDANTTPTEKEQKKLIRKARRLTRRASEALAFHDKVKKYGSHNEWQELAEVYEDAVLNEWVKAVRAAYPDLRTPNFD